MSEQKQSVGETWFMKNSAPASPKFAHAAGGKTHFPNEVSPFLSVSPTLAASRTNSKVCCADERELQPAKAMESMRAAGGVEQQIRLSQPDTITPSSSWASENPPLSGRHPCIHLAPPDLLNAMRADFASFYFSPAAYYEKKQRVSEWKRRTPVYPLTCALSATNKSYQKRCTDPLSCSGVREKTRNEARKARSFP